MNIAIIGYGKMGKAIETILIDRGHTVTLKITSSNQEEFTIENLQRTKTDVAIEFTKPESAFANIEKLHSAGVAVVCGTTGWLDKWDEAIAHMEEMNGGMVYASNFSVGVNLFFELNQHLAKLMNAYPEYKVSMEEIHHTAKKDAPSGTGITLAEGIIEHVDRVDSWENKPTDKETSIPLISKREDPAPGTHSICYSSAIDDIEIIHTAKSRQGFALGAVLAAEYIAGKKGVHTMKSVLRIG